MTSAGTVIFAHGMESGPWGLKISHLAALARPLGWHCESPDFRFSKAPAPRIAHLQTLSPQARRPLVLAGSSLGGCVAAHSCASVRPDGLFLMAPALYFPGFDAEPPDCPRHCTVVHGWTDDVVPVERAIRFARHNGATLHVVDDGHALADSLEVLGTLFLRLLAAVAGVGEAAQRGVSKDGG